MSFFEDHNVRDAIVDFLRSLSTSMSRFVTVQEERLKFDKAHMTIDDSLFQQFLDAANKCLDAEISNQASTTAALAAKDATIAELTALEAPNQPLIDSANAFLARALSTNPTPAPGVAPATPLPPSQAAVQSGVKVTAQHS